MRPDRAYLQFLALTLLLLAMPGPARAGGEALAAAVEAEEAAALDMLERAVNINSGTLNLEGVRRTGELFRPEFESLGFKTRWVEGKAFKRAGHLVAERNLTGTHVLLIGHLDTVFAKDSPFQRFERVDDYTVRGPGVTDMKGGIVVALAALRALAAANALDDLRITVLLTGDEEDVGEPLDLARAALIQAAVDADIAIGLENAADDPATAVTARRGSTSWILTVDAKTAHSSQIFREDIGAGAVFELARIVDGFYRELRNDPYLTFNPAMVLGGTQTEFKAEDLSGRVTARGNVIAPRAVAAGDLRALSLEQRESAKSRMKDIVAAHLPQTSAEITFQDSYPPMAPTEGNTRLLAKYDEASRYLGYGPVTAVDPRRAGAADISFAADHVEMAIDGLGLLGGHNHTEQEFADLRTFRVQAQRLALLLYRLAGDR